MALFASMLFAWDSPAQNDTLRLTAQRHQFSLPSWTVGNLARKWLPFAPTVSAGGDATILDSYFVATQNVREAQSVVSRLQAFQNVDGLAPAEDAFQTVQTEQLRLSKSAESIVGAQVSDFLRAQGVGMTVLGKHFPPVVFTFQEAPHALIISPRDRIEISETILLSQELSLAEIDELERLGMEQGVSVLVTRVGGVATFPSLISPRTSRHSAFEVSAHEWMHHYLFFKPLGQRYWASPEMVTLNETLADIVGLEVANQLAPIEPSEMASPSATVQVAAPAFDSRQVLRDTRISVDELLRAGQIAEAEAFMEQQRQLLVQNGIYIRKLNQAFYAFNGSYADSAASISPIGDQLRMLRADSASLAEFVRTVEALRSVDELNALVSPGAVAVPRS